MNNSLVLLVSLLVVCSQAGNGSIQKRFLWDSIKGFFNGLWDKISGKSSSSDRLTGSSSLRPNTSLEDSYNLVTDQQWEAIGNARNQVVRASKYTLALSELVEAVRNTLGPSVANLTTIELADVLYAIKLVEKYHDREVAIDALKLGSLNIPLLPILLRDLRNGLASLAG
ncbi:hypothetical protein ElyMa_006716000 [Elysia marginata]|uniref:Secreted protein n=1 Tax=Elysia marginata TaxID=1093978 RepID=A0AAV4IW20_9GAST|nr:hypothetical protein ElyMa_006716000 [Elysia marginata]